MKLFKFNNIINLILALLLGLPFFAIFGRVLYTINNKNANLSYSGNKQYPTEIVHPLELNENNDYTLDYSSTQNTISPFLIHIKCQINRITSSRSEIENYVTNNINTIGYFTINNNYQITFYDTNDSYMDYWGLVNSFTIIDFTCYGNYSFTDNNLIYSIKNQSNEFYLDNAFEYSLSTFVDDNNFGNMDFFSWFSTIFLDTTNQHNMLYINFANWYMNYALYITLSYILFMVLMWIVKLLRSILDSFGGKKYD